MGIKTFFGAIFNFLTCNLMGKSESEKKKKRQKKEENKPIHIEDEISQISGSTQSSGVDNNSNSSGSNESGYSFGKKTSDYSDCVLSFYSEKKNPNYIQKNESNSRKPCTCYHESKEENESIKRKVPFSNSPFVQGALSIQSFSGSIECKEDNEIQFQEKSDNYSRIVEDNKDIDRDKEVLRKMKKYLKKQSKRAKTYKTN